MKKKRLLSLIFAFVLLLSLIPLYALAEVPQTVITGDLNGDGAVTSDDAIYLLYHSLLGAERYPLNQSCDFDQSKEITSDDAIYLLYNTLLGEERYPLEPETVPETVAPARDLNGHEFRFYSQSHSTYNLDTHEIFAETETGDSLNDAVYRRNAQLMEDYNCTISEVKASSPAITLQENLLAGEYVADFIYDEARHLRMLAASGLLADLNESTFFDGTKEYYDQKANAGINLGGKTFFVAGDAALKDDNATYILRYNLDFVQAYDDEIDLYKEVRDGNWTIDRMYQLICATAKDLDSDGSLSYGEDRFGYYAENATNWGFVAACGATLSESDGQGGATLPNRVSTKLTDVWYSLKPLLTSENRWHTRNSLNLGGATFLCSDASMLMSAPESTYRLGVLPMPKLDQSQEQYSSTVYASIFCSYAIPATVANAGDYAANGFESGMDQAAYFLDAFFAYSKEYLTPAFYERLESSAGTADDAEMLHIALDGRIYDPVVIYDFGGINLFPKLGSNNQNDIAGTDAMYHTISTAYAEKVALARAALERYLSYIA